MTSYQVSPPKKEVKKTSIEDSATPVFLSLGAFCATPKVHFESVSLGQSKRRTLIIRNPTESPCFLKILKRPSAVFSLSFSSEEQDILIPSAEEISVTIEWKPKEEGQCFEVFQVQPSTGGSRLSVHLLGKCLPPAKKFGAKRRPIQTQAVLPKPNDPSLKLASNGPGRNSCLKPSSKVTIPVSPKFSSRLSKCEVAQTDFMKGSGDSKPSSTHASISCLLSPSPLEKLGSLGIPFTPEAQPTCKLIEPHGETVDEMDSKLPKANPQETFVLNSEQTSTLASPSRRETYLIAPSPRAQGLLGSTLRSLKQEGCENDNVPDLENCGRYQKEGAFGIPEEDSQLLENSIMHALDNELDLVHRSVDTILNEEHQAAVEAFSKLTELDEEAIMNVPFDFDDEDAFLTAKAVSGEFLCIDQSDLVPNFPKEEECEDSLLTAKIKQLFKEGHQEKEIISQLVDSEPSSTEIRALYKELSEKFKSCRDCYEVTKASHLSESFTFNRIVIQKAIRSNEIRLKPGVDIRCVKSKTSIISGLLSAFNRPWLWSALCLVFQNDKLIADDIDIMNFIDENLFWNSESMDYLDSESGRTPKELLETLAPKFLQNYLEIIYLLDATGIPAVYVPNNCTKKCLEMFSMEFLDTNLVGVLNRIPVLINENVDPIYYIVQENLRGPNVLAWTNIIKLVQELVGENDTNYAKLVLNSSNLEEAKTCLRASVEEIQKLGIACVVPQDEFDWFFNGCSSVIEEKHLWQLVIRLRISQIQKWQKSLDVECTR